MTAVPHGVVLNVPRDDVYKVLGILPGIWEALCLLLLLLLSKKIINIPLLYKNYKTYK